MGAFLRRRLGDTIAGPTYGRDSRGREGRRSPLLLGLEVRRRPTGTHRRTELTDGPDRSFRPERPSREGAGSPLVGRRLGPWARLVQQSWQPAKAGARRWRGLCRLWFGRRTRDRPSGRPRWGENAGGGLSASVCRSDADPRETIAGSSGRMAWTGLAGRRAFAGRAPAGAARSARVERPPSVGQRGRPEAVRGRLLPHEPRPRAAGMTQSWEASHGLGRSRSPGDAAAAGRVRPPAKRVLR